MENAFEHRNRETPPASSSMSFLTVFYDCRGDMIDASRELVRKGGRNRRCSNRSIQRFYSPGNCNFDMFEPILIAVIWGISFLIGTQIHERYHYWTGKLLGADPEYGGGFIRVFRTNTQFHNCESLTDREIQFISIPGHLFFFLLLILAIWPEFPTSYEGFALVGTVAGGALISWSDDMAARNPETWKKFNDWIESQDRLI